MTTEAEEAAGRELREKSFPMQPFSVKWEDLKPEIRSEWIRDAMDVVRAYQRAAWREPTAKERSEYQPKIVTVRFGQQLPGGGWGAWTEPCVSTRYGSTEGIIQVRVQDLPPLPEPKL